MAFQVVQKIKSTFYIQNILENICVQREDVRAILISQNMERIT